MKKDENRVRDNESYFRNFRNFQVANIDSKEMANICHEQKYEIK